MRNPLAIAIPGLRRAPLHEIRGSVRGRDRSKPHDLRKFYHLLMGLMCFSLYAFALTRDQALFLLATVGGAWMILDYSRLKIPVVNGAALRLFGSVMRKEELHALTANSFFVLGVAAVVLLFSKPVALFSILYLALGDPAAAIVGTRWGKHRIAAGKKSLEGMAANGVVSFLSTLAVSVLYFQLPGSSALPLAVLGSLCSMIAEILPLPFDDNLTLPVASGLLLSLALLVFPLI